MVQWYAKYLTEAADGGSSHSADAIGEEVAEPKDEVAEPKDWIGGAPTLVRGG